MIKGIVYQDYRRPNTSRHLDPIADECLDDLKQDIELLKELGLNTIFVCKITPASVNVDTRLTCC